MIALPAPAAPLCASDDVASAVRVWVKPLLLAAGARYRSLYLYGSVLEAGFDPAISDVNILIVVSELPFDTLDACARQLADPATQAGGRLRFSPLLLTVAQVKDSRDVFPLEFLDFGQRRALLDGEDVLATATVSAVNLRHQCEFKLRSKLVALRQGYLRSGAARGAAQSLAAQAAGGSAVLFRHLLTLRGLPQPETREALAVAVARAYDIDADGLGAPFAARLAPGDEATARERLARYLDALAALVEAVDHAPVG